MENYRVLQKVKRYVEEIIKNEKEKVIDEKPISENKEMDAMYKYGSIAAYNNVSKLLIKELNDDISYYYDKEVTQIVTPDTNI